MVNNNLALYANNFIKLTLEKNVEVPYVYGDIIAYLKYDNILKAYVLNHPYEEKVKRCNCGEAAFSPMDVKFIRFATDEEKALWANEYIKFHNDWLNAKGYDYCELNDVSICEILGTINLEMK